MNNLLLLQPNVLLRKLYPRAFWNEQRLEKVIYLTFDDGPIPGLSEWVLEQLDKYNAKATFFCVGDNIQKHRKIFDQISSAGHVAGNHTMFHSKGFKKTTSEYLEEVEDCKKLVNNKLFRPPYGQLRRGQYKALLKKGFNIIFWDVISYDFENISETACATNVLKNCRNGSIVLFHDNVKAEKNLRYTLPLFLEHFSALGYQFRSLQHLS